MMGHILIVDNPDGVEEWEEVGTRVSRATNPWLKGFRSPASDKLGYKGRAVMFLLESIGLSKCDDALLIYIGDDPTNEDAFEVLREGKRGCSILVSSALKETIACYSLRDPSEVMEFLELLVGYGRSQVHCDKSQPLKPKTE